MQQFLQLTQFNWLYESEFPFCNWTQSSPSHRSRPYVFPSPGFLSGSHLLLSVRTQHFWETKSTQSATNASVTYSECLMGSGLGFTVCVCVCALEEGEFNHQCDIHTQVCNNLVHIQGTFYSSPAHGIKTTLLSIQGTVGRDKDEFYPLIRAGYCQGALTQSSWKND